jgi:prepilin-type N-terminal cleavage/methylation domain-containing protein
MESKGFSLVEIMIVLAIVGILSFVAIPYYNQRLNKSKQGEAIANLETLYSSEKSFYFENALYDPRLDAVGFKPEGSLTYRIGFSADSAAAPPGLGTAGCINTGSVACPVAAVTWIESTRASGTSGLSLTAIVDSPTPLGFTAEGRARLTTADDVWVITHDNKTPQNTVPNY